MMLPLIIGFFTIVFIFIVLVVIASVTNTNVVDLILVIFLTIGGIMALIGASFEVGKRILGQ